MPATASRVPGSKGLPPVASKPIVREPMRIGASVSGPESDRTSLWPP